MWRVELETEIGGSADRAWEALVTPALWIKIDPQHYKEVNYPKLRLEVGIKGKMKSQDSPGSFGFMPVLVDDKKHELVTESKIPAGKLTITKTIVSTAAGVSLFEEVVATGPFSSLFAKLFFEKQIAGTLAAQHERIKAYAKAPK